MKSTLFAVALLFCGTAAALPCLAQEPTLAETRQAADEGITGAQVSLGLMYFRGEGGVAKDNAEAVKWMRKAADHGDAMGQMYLGNFYLMGAGVEKDVTQGLKWFTKGAEGGNAVAQYQLGTIYEGAAREARADVPVDKPQAAKWYAMAAEQGMKEAQANLGAMYARGDGVARDYVAAYKWCFLAAQQGDDMAARNIPLLEKRMTPAQVADAKAQAEQIRAKLEAAQL
jgi:TPR repeat protein